MGNAISIQHPVIDDMLKVLGLDHLSKITRIELRADCNGPVSLEIHRLIEDDEVEEIGNLFQKYHLEAKPLIEQEDK